MAGQDVTARQANPVYGLLPQNSGVNSGSLRGLKKYNEIMALYSFETLVGAGYFW